MPDGAAPESEPVQTRIGPNSILQLSAPLEALFDPGVLPQILNLARVPLPSGHEMIPQEDAARVHKVLWQLFPDQGANISRMAGQGTARYIRDHRIPKAAQLALRILPKAIAENALLHAIERHAWTFCGSGHLEAERKGDALHFILHDNPLAAMNETPGRPCLWHSAVFAELFTLLLGTSYLCAETTCRGCGGDVCRFVVMRETVSRGPDTARH